MNTKSCWQRLLLSCIVTLFLAVTTIAEAAYKPPANPSRPKGPTGSNSTRTIGCIGTAQTTLTALAPYSHFGQTVSSQPTFAWFVPDIEPHVMEFTLYEYGANGKGKLIKRVKLQSSSGIMKLSLAQEKYSLSVGQKYLWQIALLCNPNYPSEDLVAETVIEVVAMPPRLAIALSQTTEPLKRAELYADGKLWYDALFEGLEDPKNKAFSLKLLAELSFLEAEEAVRTSEQALKKDLQQQALQLQQIVAIEQQRR